MGFQEVSREGTVDDVTQADVAATAEVRCDKEAKLSPSEILALIDSLDVTDIEAEIKAKEDELSGIVKERQKAIDALKLLLRAAKTKRNGKPQRQPQRRTSSGQGSNINPRPNGTVAGKIEYYLEAAGPSSVAAIAQGIEIVPNHVNEILSAEEKFIWTGKDWSLKKQAD